MEVFAFEWCDSVYESGFRVVSLHAKKRGAYFTMRHEVMAVAREDRESALRHGDCYRRGWNGLRNQAWRVRRYEVWP